MADGAPASGGGARLVDDVLGYVRRWWRIVLTTALAAAAITAIVVALRPRTWAAGAAFVAQTRSSGGVGDLAAQAGGMLGALGGLSGLGGGGRSPEYYAELLESREIMRRVVEATYTDTLDGVTQRRTLVQWYAVEGETPGVRRDRAIERLRRDVVPVVSRPTGMISFTVRAGTPALAGQLGARLLQELQRFNQEAQQRQAEAERRFVEQRLAEANLDLQRAERRMQQFMSSNREFRTSPELSLERERLAREVQLRQQLYVSLAQAAEKARLDALRDTPVLSVLEVPEVPSLPQPRGLIVSTAVALVVGAVAGLLAAYLRDLLRSRAPSTAPVAPPVAPAPALLHAPTSAS